MYLTVNNLSKIYGEKKALDSINFTAEKGSMTCILGPSGSGKTTILRSLGGFEEVNSGTIVLNGKDVTNVSPEDRPISTVFQSYGLFPHKTVIENIIYGLKFKKLSKKNAIIEGKKVLEMVGLAGYDNRTINQLSGGEQQRVALARSLVVKPDLLLLDEPFSNLDAKLKLVMREEIQRLQKVFGITTIFVTHDQEDALSVADQIILMNKGKIEQISSPMEIYRKPQQEFSLSFIGHSNKKIQDGKLMYVRPEEIKLVAEPSDGFIEGMIEKRIFQGAIVEYYVDCGTEKILVVELLNDRLFNEGDIVYVQLDYHQL